MAWKDLTIAQRSQLMNLYRKNGIESLSQMRQMYDAFSLSPQRPDPYLQYDKADMYAGGGDKNGTKKKLAYKIGAAAKEGAGMYPHQIVGALFSPQQEYDELHAYLYGADQHFAPFEGQTTGPLQGSQYAGIPQYKAEINPRGEYVFPDSWRAIIEEAAKRGATIYSNADREPGALDVERYDAASYPMKVGYGNNGYVANAADLYDFDRDYAKRYAEKGKPIRELLLQAEAAAMRSVGNPYIVRQDGIPIRFVGDKSEYSDETVDTMNAEDLIKAISKGETGSEHDENGAIDKILTRMGMPPLEPAVITEDMPSYLRKNGGPIHIKKSKRGTFTKAAKKRGMGVQEFASKVLANKENYSPAMVKKANFARNFGGKRKKSYGGIKF